MSIEQIPNNKQWGYAGMLVGIFLIGLIYHNDSFFF